MEKNKEDSLYKWLALLVVIVGTFMAILDTSIVNIAIPKMMTVFGVSTDKIQWVLTGYMLTMGAVIPLTGYLSDTFGTKKVYIFALVAFTLGSALCGFAWSNNAMIFARVIQALGGGMIMPVSMAIIYQVIPPEERGMALGFWGIAAMAAPTIGPTLSGYIVQNLDWRLIFTINIPVGVVGTVLALVLLKPSQVQPRKPFDLLGFITSSAGLVSIMYVLGEGSSIDWHDFTNIFLLIFGAFMLILFAVNELTIENPLLDLRVLKRWPFTLSLLISSNISIALFGGVFLLPLFLQNIQGYSAMQTGILMLPGALATGIMMPIGGKLFDKLGAKPVVIPGLLILVWTTYELSTITSDTSAHRIMLLMAIRGIGMGLAMMPSTTAGMNTIPPQLVARASALNNVVRQISSSIGIALLTTILSHQQTLAYSRLSEQVSVVNPNSVDLFKGIQGLMMQQGYGAGESQGIALGLMSGLVQKQAFINALNHTLAVTTIIAAITIPLALMLAGKKAAVPSVGPGQPQAHAMME